MLDSVGPSCPWFRGAFLPLELREPPKSVSLELWFREVFSAFQLTFRVAEPAGLAGHLRKQMA
jgi:hypothetical protein